MELEAPALNGLIPFRIPSIKTKSGAFGVPVPNGSVPLKVALKK